MKAFSLGWVGYIPECLNSLPVLHLQKTKPTQHSVKGLRSQGLAPKILACRSTKVFSFSSSFLKLVFNCSELSRFTSEIWCIVQELDENVKDKLSRFCHVPVIVLKTLCDCIYSVNSASLPDTNCFLLFFFLFFIVTQHNISLWCFEHLACASTSKSKYSPIYFLIHHNCQFFAMKIYVVYFPTYLGSEGSSCNHESPGSWRVCIISSMPCWFNCFLKLHSY